MMFLYGLIHVTKSTEWLIFRLDSSKNSKIKDLGANYIYIVLPYAYARLTHDWEG